MVVDVVEASFDVALHKPADASKGILYLRQGGVAAFSRPKTMRCALKDRFIDTFQNHADGFLHQFVVCRGDTQWPQSFSAFLGNVLPSGGVRLVTAVPNLLD